MCIFFMHVNPNPKENEYRLIIATNRDEYYKRPAKSLFKCEKTGIIGGRDLEPGREGGMWLGFKSKQINNKELHSVAVILNITGAKIEGGHGRGFLVENYLNSDLNAEEYIKKLEKDEKTYNGFSLVTVELSKNSGSTCQFSNAPPNVNFFEGKQTLAFGNSPVDTPLAKVKAGKSIFQEIIDKSLTKQQLIEELLKLLKLEQKFLPDEELEKRAPQAYQLLSSIFVKIEPAGYGTRAHSIILVDYDWSFEFVEQALEQPIDINKPKWETTTVKSNL